MSQVNVSGDEPVVFVPSPAGHAENAIASPSQAVRRSRLPIHIRWMIRRDMYEVTDIEVASFPEFPWSEDEFLKCLRQRNCIGMVAESTANDASVNKIVGYMVYELHKGHLVLLNLAVHTEFRRRGVGTAMLAKLRAKLSPMRRKKLVVDVRESNLPCHLWLRACGMRATSVLRKHFDECDESAYRFVAYASGDEMDGELCEGV